MTQTQDNSDDDAALALRESTGVPSGVMRIGDWDADFALNVLRRGQQSIHLEPKAMELLFFLARRPGEVVSRDELLAALWEGVVVGDDALTQAVIKLRKAFGDNPREPSYIQTVPKRGYRLIAQVGAPVPSGDRRPNVNQGATWRPRFLSYAAIGLTAALLGLTSIYLYRAGAPPDPFPTDGVLPEADALSTTDALPTVLVHPFQVLGDDPDQLYLARGLAAELTTDLSRLSGLTAIAAETASVTLRAGAGPSARAGFEIWGGVQRSRGRIGVEVRLVEASTGRQLWAERYDRPFEDIFAVQDEIGTRLAETLSVKITEAERRRLARRFSRSVEAYDLFLRARAALLVRTQQENAQATRLFLRAIELDPAFARAYGGLALTYAADYRNQWSEDGQASLGRAQEMARTAVQIDPDLAEAHWVLGYVSAQRRRHAEALAHLDEALALAPSFGDAFALKGGIETYVGDPSASIPLLRRAMRLNPEAGYLYFLLLGRAYFFLGDSDQALINLREAITRNPANLEARVYLAAVLDDDGDRDGAEWEAQEIRAIDPQFSIRDWLQTYPMTDVRQTQRLESILARLGL